MRGSDFFGAMDEAGGHEPTSYQEQGFPEVALHRVGSEGRLWVGLDHFL